MSLETIDNKEVFESLNYIFFTFILIEFGFEKNLDGKFIKRLTTLRCK